MARGRVRTEDRNMRVRAYLGGLPVVDHSAPLLVWEKPYYPTYHFPLDAFADGVLTPTGETKRSPSRGDATIYTVTLGGKVAEDAAYGYESSPIPELEGKIALVWKKMDRWFEEDEEVFIHARDPYTRIQILQSSRNVRVEVDGVTVADSDAPRILYETGLPPRYYLPKTDVRLDLMTPTDLSTGCPYKGWARYWNVTVGNAVKENVVWGYDSPLPESAAVAGYVSFYNEKLDIYLDGELQERPKTKF